MLKPGHYHWLFVDASIETEQRDQPMRESQEFSFDEIMAPSFQRIAKEILSIPSKVPIFSLSYEIPTLISERLIRTKDL